MIPIDNDILQDIVNKHSDVELEDIQILINDVYPNGQPTSIDIHEGDVETTYFNSFKRICYNPQGKIIDDKEPLYHRGDNSLYVYDDIPLNTLQDQVELFHIRSMRFASEYHLRSINLFRYRWMGLLDRLPPMFDVLPLLPTESTTDEENMYYELRSIDQRKKWSRKYRELMELSMKLDREIRQPIGCPSLKRQLNWNKPIYLLVQQFKDKHWSKAWVDGEHINICKYLSLKYTFKKKWKHPKDIFNSFSQAQHRASKIAKPLL